MNKKYILTYYPVIRLSENQDPDSIFEHLIVFSSAEKMKEYLDKNRSNIESHKIQIALSDNSSSKRIEYLEAKVKYLETVIQMVARKF